MNRDDDLNMASAFREVLHVAIPLMVSTGMFSLVLFVDRTLLLWHEPAQMGASMAAGNLFWVSICIFVGMASMTGAIASQYVGAGQPGRIGRLLWQSVWLSLLTLPVFVAMGLFAKPLFQWTDQAPALIPMETIYFQILLWGGAGEVMQTALSGFFSGTHRTRTIAVVSVLSGIVNLLLDWLLIFGVEASWVGGNEGDRFLEMGITGAAIASVISFWFKAVAYGVIILQPKFRETYGIVRGIRWDGRVMGRLIFFGFPTGLMYVTEAGAFTVIVLMIGRLGDVPLRSTTMAINFNMIAFIPLVGMSIAASVLVGQHLIRSGPAHAIRCVWAALAIAWIYSASWALVYGLLPDRLISLYALNPIDGVKIGVANPDAALSIAEGLLGFVALYVLLDATQLILAGALRGAGDTWFVLMAGLGVSIVMLSIGIVMEPSWELQTVPTNPLENPDATWMSGNRSAALTWWWWILTAWVASLALAMTARYAQGSWKRMRMV